MTDYLVFGGRLRSALAFPELRPAPGDGPPDWTLDVAPGVDPVDRDDAGLPGLAERVGAQRYAGGVEVALLRAPDRWRVATSDLGSFDLASDGRHITWRPCAGAREELARFDLLGRVLPLALHLGGALALHGSSVALAHGPAIAFLGPKGQGKSTLALALTQGGGRLLSDDVTVVEWPAGDDAPVARPGVHAVRCWDDTAQALDVRAYGAPGAVGRKLLVTGLPDALRAERPSPLCAVYLLRPAPDADGPAPAARRTRVAATAAALALVRQTTAGGLLGGREGAVVLGRAARLAREVPVWELAIAHDFARLGEAAATVAGWHERAGTPA